MILEIAVQPFTVPAIIFNFDNLKAGLKEKLDIYQNLIVIEDEIPAYKSDRAYLNKIATALKDNVKRITSEYVIPVNEFKARVNELIEMINEPINCLDDQLEKFELKRKEEKKQEIESYFLSVCNVEGLKLDRFFNEKWLNKAESFKSIQESIQGSIQKIKDEIQAIKDFQCESEDQIMKVYYVNFSLAEALKKRQEIEFIKKQVLEEQEKQKRIAEEQARQLEEKKRLELESSEKARLETAIAEFADVPKFEPQTKSVIVSINEPIQEKSEIPIQAPIQEQATIPAKQIIKFWVEVDEVEKSRLAMFLRTANIKFGGIK